MRSSPWLGPCLVLATQSATVAQVPAPPPPVAPPPAVAEELRLLRQRIDELEEQQVKTAERLGSRAVVQAYSAQSLDFGGHVTSLFTHMEGEASSATGHMASIVELFLKAQIDEQWSLFATPGFYTFNGALLDDPTTPSVPGDPTFTRTDIAESEVFLSRIYGQWRQGDLLQVQAGVVGSPHGPSNREYFIPARTIAQANLHTRYFLANQLYPQVVQGARALGKHSLGADWLEYDAYLGVEDESADDPIGGARLAYVFAGLGLTVAANYGRGTRQELPPGEVLTNFGALQAPFPGAFNAGRDYQFVGLDLDWRSGPLLMKTEAYYSAEQGFADQRAFSTEFTWFVDPCWGVSYRFDYYDSGSDVGAFSGVVAPRGQATEHVLGLCFDPNQSVRLRLDLHHANLPNTSDTIDYLNFSWSFSF